MRHKTIDIHAVDRVAVIWLNRPEVRNALNEAMVAELSSAFESLNADDSVRAVVLAGRGACFCAGIDVEWLKRTSGAAAQTSAARRLTQMFYRLYALKKPTVARVHGTSYAGALGLIAACDTAIAAQDAEFCLSEVKLGLAAATIMPYLVHAIGERHARRYALSAEMFTAAEAYRIGLVHELALEKELDGAVNDILGHVMQGAPGAQASAKDLAMSLAAEPITPAVASRTAEHFAAIWASGEAREGISALLKKRPPAWLAPRRAAGRRKKSSP